MVVHAIPLGFLALAGLFVLALLGLFLRIASRVFYVAKGFLSLALDLLRSSLSLSLRIAGPLADLALRSTRSIVHCAFHSILIHVVHLRG